MKREAETGVPLPQTEECLEPPEAGGDKEGVSPRAFRGRAALLTLGFRSSALHLVRKPFLWFCATVLMAT